MGPCKPGMSTSASTATFGSNCGFSRRMRAAGGSRSSLGTGRVGTSGISMRAAPCSTTRLSDWRTPRSSHQAKAGPLGSTPSLRSTGTAFNRGPRSMRTRGQGASLLPSSWNACRLRNLRHEVPRGGAHGGSDSGSHAGTLSGCCAAVTRVQAAGSRGRATGSGDPPYGVPDAPRCRLAARDGDRASFRVPPRCTAGSCVGASHGT